MMKLGTMRAVVATLNERGESPLANEILLPWSHDAATICFWRASANFLFGFQNAGRAYVLRFVEAAQRSVEAIAAELAFVEYLAARGIRAAPPVRSIAGNLIETADTQLGGFNAIVFERLPGEQYALEELTPNQVTRWGRALAELHTAAEGYRDSRRPTWQDQLKFVRERLTIRDDDLRTALRRIVEQLEEIPVSHQSFGLIHFDFELDNLVWNDGQIGIVDFDDCAFCWFAADIAFALRHLFGDSATQVNLQLDPVQRFLEGYRTVREIGDTELERIPLFLEMHNLITLARIQDSLEPDGTLAEPTWLAELRKKLRTKMAFYRAQLAIPRER